MTPELKGPNRLVVRAAIRAVPFHMLCTLLTDLTSRFDTMVEGGLTPRNLDYRQWKAERGMRAALTHALGCWEEEDA